MVTNATSEHPSRGVADLQNAAPNTLRSVVVARLLEELRATRVADAAAERAQRAATLAERQDEVARLLEEQRATRMADAAAERAQRAATLAERQDEVARLLEEQRATRTADAAAEHTQRAATLAERRSEVARLLEELRATRMADAAAERAQRAATLAERRSEVARLLEELRARRRTAAATQRARLRSNAGLRRHRLAAQRSPRRPDEPLKPYVTDDPALKAPSRKPAASRTANPARTPGAPAASTASPALSDLGYAGLVAYAQMTRVAILRELERGAPENAALQRQLEAHLESLQSNVQPLLDELSVVSSGDAQRQEQLLEVVEGVRRSVETLSSDLGALPWPAAPEQQPAFAATIARLYERLKPLQAHLDTAAARLRPGQPRSRAGQRGRSQNGSRDPLVQTARRRATH